MACVDPSYCRVPEMDCAPRCAMAPGIGVCRVSIKERACQRGVRRPSCATGINGSAYVNPCRCSVECRVADAVFSFV
eukprot:122496-Prymnesium_polylepis.1